MKEGELMILMYRLYCRYDRTRNIQLFDYLMVGAVVSCNNLFTNASLSNHTNNMSVLQLVTWGNTVLNYYQVTFGKGIHFPDLVTPVSSPASSSPLSPSHPAL